MEFKMQWVSLLLIHVSGTFSAGAAREPCAVRAASNVMYAQRGELVLLNCTTSCTQYKAFHWETGLLKSDLNSGDGWVSTKVNVTADNSTAKCLMNFVNNTDLLGDAVTVTAYALPERPQISVSRWIEKGSTVTAICEVPRAFPAENVTVEMSFDQSPLSVTITSRTDGAVVANAPLTPTSTGTYNLGCTAHIFGSSNDRFMDINIYEHPKIAFSLSNASADLGGTVTASCRLTNDRPESYSLHISMDGRQGCSETSYAARSCNLTADRKSPTAVITCEARLKENPNITTTAKKNLTVYYRPGTPTLILTPSADLKKGDPLNVTCHSNGSPLPEYRWIIPPNAHVTYSRENSTIIIPQTSPSHRGNYICEATNSYGTARGQQEVLYVTDNIGKWLAIGLISVAVVALVVYGIVCWLRRHRRRGDYIL
ncbi:intercellular adhesion molecule 3 isoform X2 [Ascaphus truei]|uniref:intercellular adhesion molecule 3 isoform X2 n=1 Tax=Ascaphus truei TaxID=8439 RepID=UPI003F5AABBF